MVTFIGTLVYIWSLCFLGIIAVSMVDDSKRFVVALLVGINFLTYSILFLKVIHKRITNEIPQQT
jgi:hypothetical protein